MNTDQANQPESQDSLQVNSRDDTRSSNQFALFTKKRYGPFFLTMFLGAFNDNLFRSALLMLVGFYAATVLGENPAIGKDQVTTLSVVLFMLPYFFFSAIAGQLADKFDKTFLVRCTKLFELFVMCCAALAFYSLNIYLLLFLLFLMGTQSAFFSPMKYAILPQHLRPKELVGGNGMLELGTFLAILFGLMLGGELMKGGISLGPDSCTPAASWQVGLYCATGISGPLLVAIAGVALALAGLLSSLRMPAAPSSTPNLTIDFNVPRNTWRHFKLAYADKHIWRCMLGVSFFWSIGGIYLAQMSNYAVGNLAGGTSHYILLLACFASGIGLGSAWCEILTKRYLAIAWAWPGALGVAVFGLLLYFVSPETAVDAQSIEADQRSTIPLLWADVVEHWPVLLALVGLGVSGGLFSVPLTAEIQRCAKPDQRAQVIAANNIINAAAMIVSGGLVMLLSVLGADIPLIFLFVGLVSLAVLFGMFWWDQRYFITGLVYLITRLCYRVEIIGSDNIPRYEPVLLTSNHVAWMDWFVIGAMLPLPPHFIMNHEFYKIPVVRHILRSARVVPIAPEFQRPDILERALNTCIDYLKAGDSVYVFPEGKVSRDGELLEFRTGIDRIHAGCPVPVVPMAIRGMWGSWFSFSGGRCMSGPPKRWGRSRIEIVVGEPIPPEEYSLELLKERIEALRGDWK